MKCSFRRIIYVFLAEFVYAFSFRNLLRRVLIDKTWPCSGFKPLTFLFPVFSTNGFFSFDIGFSFPAAVIPYLGHIIRPCHIWDTYFTDIRSTYFPSTYGSVILAADLTR